MEGSESKKLTFNLNVIVNGVTHIHLIYFVECCYFTFVESRFTYITIIIIVVVVVIIIVLR